MKIREMKEQSIADFLPYSYHVTPEIISTKEGMYVSCFKLNGRSHEGISALELARWVSELNDALRMVSSANTTYWSHLIRRRVYDYPIAKFDNIFCKQLDVKYRESFENYNLMVNDLYFSVVFNPNADRTLALLSKAERMSADERQHRQESAIKKLVEINNSLQAALEPYGATLLSTYEHNGRAYTAMGEFYSSMLNGESIRVPVLRNRISNYIASNRLLFDEHGELGEIRLPNSSKLFGMVEIFEYDPTTEPGQLNILMQSDYEFVLTQSFSVRSRAASLAFLKRHKKQLADAKDAAQSQINDIQDAMDRLASGQFVMGEHHLTVRISGDSVVEVRENLGRAKAALVETGIIATIVDGKATEAAFWAQFPGNRQFRPRPQPITSENFLSFSSFHNYATGKSNGNPWGPAVVLFKTVSGTPHYFNFHVTPIGEDSTGSRPVGNCGVIGKTGSGKTVLLGMLMAQLQKYPATIVALDKDNGMEIQIRAMGGRYLPLEIGHASGWNPFQLEPTPSNLAFVKRLVIRMATTKTDPVTHKDEEQINQALNTVMREIPRRDRRLSRLLESLPNPIVDDQDSRPSVHARLLKWCEGGEHGWLFDNEKDLLDLTTHRIYGFDLTELYEVPELLDTAMEYLLHRTESMIDGRPFVYVADEFWRSLDVPIMRDKSRDKIKTIRKENGIFVYATQEPGDALKSEIGKTLVQGCATYIYLPNPDADYDDYVHGFKVTEAEFKTIKSLPEKSRRFLIKQGGNSAIAELNLRGFDDELTIMSGTPDNARIAREVIASVGEDPAVWLPAFFKRLKAGVSVAPLLDELVEA